MGDGPDRPELEALARELGVEQATHFVGFQDDVGPWFHAFDALLLPSRNEGTPVSAIETSAQATTSVKPSGGSRRCWRLSSARMNENSPTWARPRATVSAVRDE